MSDRKKLALGIILFGSIWGGLEVLGIDIMRRVDFSLRAPILTLVGVIVLMTARVIFPKPGSTALIGVMACASLGRREWQIANPSARTDASEAFSTPSSRSVRVPGCPAL